MELGEDPAGPQGGMFRGRSAWFSQSVPPELYHFWVVKRVMESLSESSFPHGLCLLKVGEGGVIVNLEAADYLFSSNASHPDTKRIHQSLDYLEGRLTVFHSCFLTASINAEIKNTVPLGHFILLPASLQKEIRKKIGHFIWEQITSPVQDLHYRPLILQSGLTAESKSIKKQEQIRDKKELEKCQGPRTSETGKLTYIPLQDYPSSNMVTGYTSEKQLKKFLGEIRDFIPGCSGYLAYWIPNETSLFSDAKMKLKRKS